MRPSITFPAAVELIQQSLTSDPALQDTFISTELLKPIDCEHCYKVEDLRLRSYDLHHVNILNDMPDYALLGMLEHDGTSCLRCATMIHEKTKHLLKAPASPDLACNTSLHHAARCRNVRTIFHLISLVSKEGGNAMVSHVLRMRNKQAETPLHQAVKLGNINMVKLLLWIDSDLAGVPDEDTSVSYLAVSLRHRIVAKTLHEWGSNVSFVGPMGKNVLHAAVLHDKDMVSDILKWDATLAQKADANGNIPLHLASLTPYHQVSDCTLLLGYKEAVYRSNRRGLFPIHMSASSDQISMTRRLIAQWPKCILLRDPAGKTLLHFSVLNRCYKTISHIQENWKMFAEILNARDTKGNTPLHLAIEIGDLDIVCSLLCIPDLLVDALNEEKQTALDLAMMKCEKHGNVYWEEHDDAYIKRSLQLIGAKCSCYHSAHLEMDCMPASPRLEDKETEKLTACSEKLAIASALIAACTFAAGFTLPGGVSDVPDECGMLKLAKGPIFSTLGVSNWLGFLCSIVATLCAMMASMPLMIQLKYRRFYVNFAYFFTKSSLTALVTTISLLASISYSPESKQTAYLIWLGNPFAFFIVNSKLLLAGYTCALPMLSRHGKCGKMKFVLRTFVKLMLELWPLVITGIWFAGSYHVAKVWRVCPEVKH